MSVWDSIKHYLAEVLQFVEAAFKWLAEEENQSTVRGIIEVVMMILGATDALNEPVPKRDRPKVARTTLEILQKLTPEDLRDMAMIKEEGNFDELDAYELDAVMGLVIGGYVKAKKPENKRKGKTL